MKQWAIKRKDAATGLLMVVLGGIAGIALQSMTGGLVPQRNVYFNADTDRVVANLVDPLSNFSRLKLHPLYGLLCAAFQKLLVIASADTALTLLATVGGALYALLLFTAVRLWGGSRTAAITATLVGFATSAFLYWVGVPETHFWGGLSVLGAIVVARLPIRSREGTLLASACMLLLTFSMVITNVAAWVILRVAPSVPAGLGRTRWRGFLGSIPRWIVEGLAGLGLVFLFSTLQSKLFATNDSIGMLTTKIVSTRPPGTHHPSFFQVGHWLGELNAVSFVGANVTLGWVVNLAMIALLVRALFVLDRSRRAVVLIPLFGTVFHIFFDRAHAFLFGPNYTPAALVALAIGWNAIVPFRWGRLVPLVALALVPLNLTGYRHTLGQAAEHSDPVSLYARMRGNHPVPPNDLVRPAFPYISPDE